MHVLANDDDDGSNDASDLVEERSSLAKPMKSHEAVKNEKKKKGSSKPILKPDPLIFLFFNVIIFYPCF